MIAKNAAFVLIGTLACSISAAALLFPHYSSLPPDVPGGGAVKIVFAEGQRQTLENVSHCTVFYVSDSSTGGGQERFVEILHPKGDIRYWESATLPPDATFTRLECYYKKGGVLPLRELSLEKLSVGNDDIAISQLERHSPLFKNRFAYDVFGLSVSGTRTELRFRLDSGSLFFDSCIDHFAVWYVTNGIAGYAENRVRDFKPKKNSCGDWICEGLPPLIAQLRIDVYLRAGCPRPSKLPLLSSLRLNASSQSACRIVPVTFFTGNKYSWKLKKSLLNGHGAEYLESVFYIALCCLIVFLVLAWWLHPAERRVVGAVDDTRIRSLAGLKVIALASIFWLHSWTPKPTFELGVIGVNFFFCASGFLIGRKYMMDAKWGGIGTACVYCRGKLIRIWPMYLLGIMIAAFALPAYEWLQAKTYWMAIANIFMLQAWGTPTKELAFSFNGPTWFLSSLMFCYFIAPAFMSLVRRMRSILMLFVLVLGLRYLVETVQTGFPDVFFSFDLYCSPIIRLLEFCSAMCLGCIYSYYARDLRVRFSSRQFFIMASCLELMVLISLYVWAFPNAFTQSRATMVWWYLLAVLIFSFDAGAFSKLFGTRLLLIASTIELEFYIFHGAILKFMRNGNYIQNQVCYNFVAVAVICLLSCTYKWYCAPTAEKIMVRIFDWIQARLRLSLFRHLHEEIEK